MEINAVTDNPLLFPDKDRVFSGGNFHGQPVAQVLDFLALALADLGNIAERRVNKSLDPNLNDGLPAFLTEKGGLNSGLMMLQYTAASLVSENKTLANPASVDSIPSSANQEDHVSMGMIAARQLRKLVKNLAYILAIEMIVAAQAVDFRAGDPHSRLGAGTRVIYEEIRERVPFVDADTEMSPFIEEIAQWILSEEGVIFEHTPHNH